MPFSNGSVRQTAKKFSDFFHTILIDFDILNMKNHLGFVREKIKTNCWLRKNYNTLFKNLIIWIIIWFIFVWYWKNFRSWFARIFFYDFSLSPAHDIPWILSKTINPFKRDWAKTTTFFMFGIIFIFWNAAQTFLFGRMPWDFRTLTIGICEMLKKSQPGFSTYPKFPHYNYTFSGLKF